MVITHTDSPNVSSNYYSLLLRILQIILSKIRLFCIAVSMYDRGLHTFVFFLSVLTEITTLWSNCGNVSNGVILAWVVFVKPNFNCAGKRRFVDHGCPSSYHHVPTVLRLLFILQPLLSTCSNQFHHNCGK